MARTLGLSTLLNASPMRPIDPATLADAAILVVNAVEAADLSLGAPEAIAEARVAPPAIAALLDGGLELLVVTLGEGGAVAFRPGQPPLSQPAFAVAAVEPVGAGDAFTAGLMAGLLARQPLDATLRQAAACGALTTCRFGASDAFPTAQALAAFLDKAAL